MTTASRRRELVEEVLRERSRAVVLGVLEEPPASSGLWPLGIVRLVAVAPARSSVRKRELARSAAVVALAWLEAIDAELFPGGDAGDAGPQPTPP